MRSIDAILGTFRRVTTRALTGIGTTKGDLLVNDGTEWQRLGAGSNTQVLKADSAESLGLKWGSLVAPAVEGVVHAACATVGDGTTVVTTGPKGFIVVPYDGTITGWYLTASESGGIVIDVWKDVWAHYPPTDADSIAGTELPTLSGTDHNSDEALDTWTTTVTAGDVLGFNVDSCSGITRAVLVLNITEV